MNIIKSINWLLIINVLNKASGTYQKKINEFTIIDTKKSPRFFDKTEIFINKRLNGGTIQFNRFDYYISNNVAGWWAAHDDCTRTFFPHGHIISLESKEELEFIQNELERYGIGTEYWMSGKYEKHTTTFTWFNGDPLANWAPWAQGYPPNKQLSSILKVTLVNINRNKISFKTKPETQTFRYICENPVLDFVTINPPVNMSSTFASSFVTTKSSNLPTELTKENTYYTTDQYTKLTTEPSKENTYFTADTFTDLTTMPSKEKTDLTTEKFTDLTTMPSEEKTDLTTEKFTDLTTSKLIQSTTEIPIKYICLYSQGKVTNDLKYLTQIGTRNFYRSIIKLTWKNAENYCVQNNMQLMEIKNLDEFNKVRKILIPILENDKSWDRGFWVGSSVIENIKDGKSHEYYWNCFNEKILEPFWSNENPSRSYNGGSYESCVQIVNFGSKTIGLNDYQCHFQIKFICQDFIKKNI